MSAGARVLTAFIFGWLLAQCGHRFTIKYWAYVSIRRFARWSCRRIGHHTPGSGRPFTSCVRCYAIRSSVDGQWYDSLGEMPTMGTVGTNEPPSSP